MSDLDLKYCPYCKKNVPYRKANRGGALAFGIIASIIVPLELFVVYMFVYLLRGYIILIISIGVFVVFELLYWRWYKRKLRYFCTLCKTTVQPKLVSSNTSVAHPSESEAKVAYCPNCGKQKTKDSAEFCSYCGTKL